VERRVRPTTRAVPPLPVQRWSVWKYNWIIKSKIIRALERVRHHARGVLLDLGCGDRAFESLFADRVSRYIGVDLPDSPYPRITPDIYARAEALPLRDGSVDTVLGLSMLTCLPEPARMLEEVHRVLEPGGTLILEFTQMVPLHDEPHDYFRFTRLGARWLLERAGFEVLEAIPVGGLMTRVALTSIAALNRVNRGPTRVLTEIPVRLLYVVLQSGFALLDRVFFDPREVVGHIVVARRNGAPKAAKGSP
jgi:SAM-dependent methyltransferase